MLPKEKSFRVGPFTFSRLKGLYRGTKPVPLRHLERQLLKCLLDRPGEIVRKEELVAALWPGIAVSANTLNVLVRRLRVALDDTQSPARLLTLVPRMGYLLVADPQTKRRPAVQKGITMRDKSRFIRDVTIPDGSIMAAGERFEKVWEIQNVGATPWRNRRMRRTGACEGPGRLISEPNTVIPDTDAGELCLVRMWLTAPGQPGSYYASWKMVSEKGDEALPAQSPLFVSIDVVQEHD